MILQHSQVPDRLHSLRRNHPLSHLIIPLLYHPDNLRADHLHNQQLDRFPALPPNHPTILPHNQLSIQARVLVLSHPLNHLVSRLVNPLMSLRVSL